MSRRRPRPAAQSPMYDPTERFTCPLCGFAALRLPSGRMRWHVDNRTLARLTCAYPAQEWSDMQTADGRALLTIRRPQWAHVYQRSPEARPEPRHDGKRRHGGRLRNPDPTDPDWRWRG